MKIQFWKMSGAGNDFVCVDNRRRKLRLNRRQISRLCHRQFGIGADGLLLLETASKGADFRMRYYNADGGEAEMCGNGARCFARFAQRLTRFKKKVMILQTKAGPVTAEFLGRQVRVELTPPQALQLDVPLPTSQGQITVHSVNTGVPHAIVFVPDAELVAVLELGRELRFHQAFQPKGTNVNFVQRSGTNSLRVRTYERGVEGETLACGTGVAAAALVAAAVHDLRSPVSLKVQGGDTLKVYFARLGYHFGSVKLQGPADFVYEGEMDV